MVRGGHPAESVDRHHEVFILGQALNLGRARQRELDPDFLGAGHILTLPGLLVFVQKDHCVRVFI